MERRSPPRLLATLALAVALGASLACSDRAEVAPAETAAAATAEGLELRAALEERDEPPLGLPREPWAESRERLGAFYEGRGYEPVWIAGPVLRGQARSLLDALEEAEQEGLDPADYEVPRLLRAVEALEGEAVPVELRRDLELALTWAALSYADHLLHGRVSAEVAGERWQISAREGDASEILRQALEGEDPGSELRGLRPPNPQYERLIEARDRYLAIVEGGGWPSVPEGPVLAEGDAGDARRVRSLAARLRAEGFLPRVPSALRDGGETLPYGPELAEGLRRFQRSRTLAVDGKLGGLTAEELNVPASERLAQIELNLERWRWMPRELGGRAVVVNIPGYWLRGLEEERTALEMGVVVGKEGWPTPVFQDRIEYMEANPYWNVPTNIAREDIVPRLRRDPGYLEREGFEVVRGWGGEERVVSLGEVSLAELAREGSGIRLRQRPGPSNALGRLKFMFPNDYDVYLHDTPAGHLFGQADRGFSHGCVRVEEPLRLAEWLLETSGSWDLSRLQQLIASARNAQVPMQPPVPVYLVYWTAWVGEEGGLEFYEDVYGIDEAQRQALLREGYELGAAR